MTNSIETIHEAFNTPEGIIFSLVHNSTGQTPIKRTKVLKGYASEVYDVQTQEGVSFIVKIAQSGSLTYKQEQWAMDSCRKVGVPVPRVFGLGEVEVDGLKEYVVLEKMSGKPFADVRQDLNEEQINKILFNAGSTLRKIHSISAGGFYQRHEDGNWDFPTWRAYMESVVTERTKEKECIIKAGFSENEFKKMISFLKHYRDDFVCDQPVLCQGDYLPEHIFVGESLEMTGIIDFGMYEGNHPIHDLAYFSFEVPSLSLELMKEGYGTHEMFEYRFEERLQLHKLMLMMGHLSYHVRENMQPEIAFVAGRLRETLKSFNQSE